MPKIYECALEVRGYELDSFGHVNHAVYISYLEHARWELLRQEGIGLPEFNAWQRWPVIAKLEVSYLKPTFLADRLIVRSEMHTASRTSFVADQKIYRGETLVFEGKVTIVIVNEKGRPAELPSQVQGLLE
jgi:YbgC/YbaW family acyl-CoA thioester hydrolase